MALLSASVASNTGLPSLRFTPDKGVHQKLVAACGDDKWVLWDGVGDGGEVILSDPMAPLGVFVEYSLGEWVTHAKRESVGSHLITDESGRLRARVVLLGEDGVEHSSGVSTLDLASGVADRWPLRRVPEQLSVEFRTEGAGTRTVRLLSQYRGSVILLHDPSVCEVEGCDIPLVRRGVIVSAREKRTAHVDRAVREWELKLSDRSRGVWRGGVVVSSSVSGGGSGGSSGGGFGASTVTWGEWQKFDGGWKSRSYSELCRLIAGVK